MQEAFSWPSESAKEVAKEVARESKMQEENWIFAANLMWKSYMAFRECVCFRRRKRKDFEMRLLVSFGEEEGKGLDFTARIERGRRKARDYIHICIHA